MNDIKVSYSNYKDEYQLPEIQTLAANNLSEPYSIFTYRYFLNNWPQLAFIATDSNTNKIIGIIIAKIEPRRKKQETENIDYNNRGYIAMLVVDYNCRRHKIGYNLLKLCIEAMQTNTFENHESLNLGEVVLETESFNNVAINFYSQNGFIKDKLLCKYYCNLADAYRMKLRLIPDISIPENINPNNIKSTNNKKDNVINN